MKRANYLLILICFIIACGCEVTPEVELEEVECSVLPAGGRASACACALDGKGYVFAGRDAKGNYLNDLWQYDPTADSWTQVAVFPGAPRVNATMIAYKGHLYMGLGFVQGEIYVDQNCLRDWWRWDPATNQWDSLAPYPDATTIAAVPYSVDDRIYVIYGSSYTVSRQINWYEPATNTWHQEEDSHYRAISVFKGVGAQIDGQCYFGLGYNQKNEDQWYRVNLPEDDWAACSAMPGKGRTCSACAATDDYIYVFGGRYFGGEMTGGEVYADIYRFNPLDGTWVSGGAMPCGRAENLIAFTIDNKVYFGLGENEKGEVIDQLYCIEK